MISRFLTRLQDMRSDEIAATLAKGITSAFGLNIIGRLVSFLLFVILARMIGVQEFGYYVIAWSWGQLLMSFGKFGSDAAASKYVAAYRTQEEWSLFHGHLRYGFVLVLAKSSGLALLGALVVWWFEAQIGKNLAHTLYITMVMLPSLSLIHFVQASLRAVGDPVRGIFANTVFRSGFQIILVLLLPVLGIRADAVTATVTALVSSLVALAMAMGWLRQYLRGYPKAEARRYEHKEWYVYSFYILLIASADMIFRQTDTIMLGWLAGAEEAGLYGTASRIGYFVIFGISAANFVITPMISGYHSAGDRRQLQRTVTYAAWLVFALSSAISLALVIAGPFLLSLFGHEFKSALATQNILILGQWLSTLAGPVGSLMIMTGYEKQSSLIFIGVAFLNVVLNALLIPSFGKEGAAIATAISFAVWNVIFLIFIVRRLDINPTIFTRLKTDDAASKA